MMSDLEIYDKALFAYLLSLCKDVTYSPTDKARMNITKKNKDVTPWPFISFYRDADMQIDMTRYGSAAVRGDYTRVHTHDGVTDTEFIHSIPVNLTYQVDIWGTTASEVQVLAQSLLTRLHITNPVLLVPINPEGENGRFHFTDISWTDNSDLDGEEDKNKIYRHTVTVTVDARIKHQSSLPLANWGEVPIEIY